MGTRWSLRAVTGGMPAYPLLVLFGLNAVDELDAAAFNVLLPTIRDHFDMDNEGVLTLVALVAPIAILIGLPVAWYADRAKRTAIAATGGGIWGFFSFLTGAAVNVPMLAVARAGSSIGKAVNLPVHNSLLSDYYPVTTRARVYGFHRAANSVGLLLGPLLAGLLSFAFGFRAPFVVFAALTAGIVLLALGMKEPRRGQMERAAAGADGATAQIEDPPQPFGESWRLLHSIVTLRRMYMALPFLAAALFSSQSLVSLFYEEVYGVGDVGRGVLLALDEPWAILGVIVGAPIAQRAIASDPGRALRLVGLIALCNALPLVLIAVSPAIGFAMAGSALMAFIRALIYPAILAVFSLVIPPRARSLGFQGFAVWSLPGLIVLPIIGAVGDSVGFRWAILILAPLYALGAFILSTAAPAVAQDIENNRKWSLLEARARQERQRLAAAVAAGEAPTSALPLLEVRDIDFSYGAVQVLFDVSLEVERGARVALLGTNGAGKSTLLKVISGLLQPDLGSGGSVWFRGEDVTWMLPEQRAQLGMVQVGGGRAMFPSLTVEESLRIGAYPFLGDEALVRERLQEVLDIFPVLASRARQRAGTLSGGEQQMVALGRAMIAGPELLMIDELSLGLAPVVMGEILHMVQRFVDQGTTLLLVEQSLNVAAGITELAQFMEKGEIRFSGPTSDLLDRGDLARSVFFGERAAT